MADREWPVSMDIISVARSRWIPVVLLTVLGLLGGYLLAMATTKQYRATADVLFSVDGANSVTDLDNGASYIQKQMPTYAELATSVPIRKDAAAAVGLSGFDAPELKALTTTIPTGTAVLSLATLATDKGRAVRVVDSVAAAVVRASAVPNTREGQFQVKATILSPGVAEAKAAKPNVPMLVVLGGLAGSLVGVGLALLLELRSQRRRTGRARRAD